MEKKEAAGLQLWKKTFSLLLPFFPGLLAFTLVIGWSLVNPAYYQWLLGGDPAQQFIGWCFYRHTPWSFPLVLANPHCGLELSSTLIFTDSLPLVSFWGKILDPFLPDPCQLTGLWVLSCFLFQSWFAWKLIGLVTQDVGRQLPATGLLVFAPAFLWRMYSHWSDPHWCILAALYITLGQPRMGKGMAWLILVPLATLIHAYVSLMVGALWLADLARRFFWERRENWALLKEVAAISALVLIISWQQGLFWVHAESLPARGFGFFRNNLLSLFNPESWHRWSYVLPGIPVSLGERFEGFNYIGLGGLSLILLSLPFLIAPTGSFTFPRQYVPLALVITGLTLFSFSNVIGFGPWSAPPLPLPDALEGLAHIFRSSARMFWPAYYLIFWLLIRMVILNYSRELAVWFLFLAFLAQAVDSSAGWLPETRKLRQGKVELTQALEAPFWQGDFSGYEKLRYLPTEGLLPPELMTLAYFSETHGLATDTMYFSRIDHTRYGLLNETQQAVLRSGRFDLRTVYILDQASAVQARAKLDRNRDRLFQVDHFYVLLPGAREDHREVRTERNVLEL